MSECLAPSLNVVDTDSFTPCNLVQTFAYFGIERREALLPIGDYRLEHGVTVLETVWLDEAVDEIDHRVRQGDIQTGHVLTIRPNPSNGNGRTRFRMRPSALP